MGWYILVMTNLVYLGVTLWFLYDGLRVAIFGGGYRLLGGRESFGWGARVAGVVLASPLALNVITWWAILGQGNVTLEAIKRGDHNALAMALTAVILAGCFIVSYVFAEFTNTPYWAYIKKGEKEEEEEDPEEGMTEKEKQRRKRKLERKLQKAREIEEERQRQLILEEQRHKQRQEARQKGKEPPPIPRRSDRDDDSRRRYRD